MRRVLIGWVFLLTLFAPMGSQAIAAPPSGADAEKDPEVLELRELYEKAHVAFLAGRYLDAAAAFDAGYAQRREVGYRDDLPPGQIFGGITIGQLCRSCLYSKLVTEINFENVRGLSRFFIQSRRQYRARVDLNLKEIIKRDHGVHL